MNPFQLDEDHGGYVKSKAQKEKPSG